jgi:hypothetical protein
MSSHLYVYVGWFFMVPKVMAERVTKTPACVNTACPAHGVQWRVKFGAKFCQDCGQPLGVIETRSMVEQQVSLYDVDDVLDGKWVDEMRQLSPREGGEHFWVPNHRGYGTTMSEYDDNEPVIMLGSEVETEFERFKARYGAFQKAVEQAKGITLQPAYGVLPYYS